jgi:hypothetical protein
MQERDIEAGELFVRALEGYRLCNDAYGQVEVTYKLASWHHTHSRLTEAKTLAETAFELAQKHGLVPWEIRLLWLMADLALQTGDTYGINFYAYAAVRSRDIGDDKRLTRSLTRIKAIMQMAVEEKQPQLAEEIRSRSIAVWQDPDWNAMMVDLVEQFQQLPIT